MSKALIISIVSGEYELYDEQTKTYFLAKPRGVFRKNQIVPKVGDTVTYISGSPFSTIIEVHERKNDLIRPSIANIDQAFVVTSLKEPDLNLNLLDRFICILEYNNITPILVFSKIDLVDDKAVYDIIDYYKQIGYLTYLTTTKQELDILPLKELMKGKISVITGQSGVGKSSILNVLNKDVVLETNEISKALNRGKHTTRQTKLYSFEEGWIADSPGFGAIEFYDMDEVMISHAFIEFFKVSNKCKFSGCLHNNEPSCEVKKLVDSKNILTSRYQNYIQIINEIKNKRKW